MDTLTTTVTQRFVRHIRTTLDLNQAELARIAGVSQPTIARWQSGVGEMDLESARRIRRYAIGKGRGWLDTWVFDPPEQE